MHKPSCLITILAALCIFMGSSSCSQRSGSIRLSPTDRVQQIITESPRRMTSRSAKPAIVYIDSAIGGLAQLSTEERIVLYEHKSNFYNNSINDYDSAIVLANEALKLIEKEGVRKYKADYVMTYYLLGDAYYRKGAYKKAYDYYIKASSMGQVSGDSCTKAAYAYRVAMILFRQTNYEDAANYFKQSLVFYGACSRENGTFYATQEILDNIGLSYACMKSSDSAIKYYQLALDYLSDTVFIKTISPVILPESILKSKAVVYGNMGGVYRLLKQYDKAGELFRKSISINGSGYDLNDAQTTRFKLADLYYDEHKPDSMKQVLEEVENAKIIFPPDMYPVEINRLWWKYYDYIHDTATGYRYLKLFTMQYERYRLNDLARRDENISQQIKIVAKQNDIDTLRQDNKVNRIYIKLATVLIVLVVLMFGLIYNNWIKSRKNLAVQTRLTREVFKQKKQLEDFNNEKDRIMQIVAHDLRSPVSAVYMFTDLIRDEKSEENKAEMLQLIKTASENALTLISEMLEAPFANQGKLTTETADMGQLLKACVELLRFRAFEKNQVINESLPQSPVMANVNKEKMSRVISNLIINAIKFSPAFSEIEVQMYSTADEVRIIIRDHGIGIPDKLKSKVFEMFTDARRPGTNGERPFGLGLSICRQIVTAHNGKIWFESKQGDGSTFFVSLKKANDNTTVS